MTSPDDFRDDVSFDISQLAAQGHGNLIAWFRAGIFVK
jgi:hypothetical protein